jgi:hypothetical protein
MSGEPKRAASEAIGQRAAGLDDPRAVDILTTEHWSLLSTRSLGYQEMFGRTTIFVGILSGFVVALAFLAQATHFSRETLLIALLLMAVALFIGITTFVRSVAINVDDARHVAGMSLLRQAYVDIVPGLEPYFVGIQHLDAGKPLAHGSPQRLANLAMSLTTTSSVVAALNSVLAGALASDVSVLLHLGAVVALGLGVGVSVAAAILHVTYAARFRQRHGPLGG